MCNMKSAIPEVGEQPNQAIQLALIESTNLEFVLRCRRAATTYKLLFLLLFLPSLEFSSILSRRKTQTLQELKSFNFREEVTNTFVYGLTVSQIIKRPKIRLLCRTIGISYPIAQFYF